MIWKACAGLAFAVILTLAASAVEAAPPPVSPFVGSWSSLNPPSGPDATLVIAEGGHALSVTLTDADDDLFCEGAVSATGRGHATGRRQLVVNFDWTCQSDGNTTHRTVLFRLNPVFDNQMAYFNGGVLTIAWLKNP